MICVEFVHLVGLLCTQLIVSAYTLARACVRAHVCVRNFALYRKEYFNFACLKSAFFGLFMRILALSKSEFLAGGKCNIYLTYCTLYATENV